MRNISKIPSFSRSAGKANSISPQAIFLLLQPHVPHLRFVAPRESLEADRAGTDFVAFRSGGRRPLNVDLKELSFTPAPGQKPPVLLETAMHGGGKAEGWATDETKSTDLYLMVYGDGSHLVLSARRVREALNRHGDDWAARHRTGTNATRGFYETFHSDYVLVPRRELSAACAEVAKEWRG